MSSVHNEFEQPIGEPLPEWTARPRPSAQPLVGRYCRLDPLVPERHAEALFAAFGEAADDRLWTYMAVGPFASLAAYHQALLAALAQPDACHYAVIDQTSGLAVGTLALMRMDPANGVIEVGQVSFSPRLQRTRAATEAHYLLMRQVFEELGYRRYEWKCDSLNAPSRQAALRLGFEFEGVFRQAMVYKQRSRDTAWFSVIDRQWPGLRQGFESWLAPENFTAEGVQLSRLASGRPAA